MNRPFGLPGFRQTFNEIVAAVVRVRRFIDFPEIALPPNPEADTLRLFVRESGGITVLSYLRSDGTLATMVPPASQAEQETGTTLDRVVITGRQQFHPGHPKFWGYAAGDGSSLLASHNVTSITDTAEGRLTVTIATDFSSVNWADHFNTLRNLNAQVSVGSSTGTKTGGSIEFYQFDVQTTNLSDPTAWSFSGFGDQA
jgi:hypothetical protein